MQRRKALKILGGAGMASLIPLKLFGEMRNVVNNPICVKAWKGLSKFTAQRYQFRYVEPVKNLPKVFIYGDSISIGYTEYVRNSLEGVASVVRIHENGGASDSFITKMEKLRKAMFQPYLKEGWNFEWDLIHFNVGLHDLKYVVGSKLDKVNGKQVSSLKQYKDNLEKIVDYLKSTYPKAKLIFATTTTVPEGEPGRIAGDEIRYNEVAVKVMKKHKIDINDLYTFSKPIIQRHAEGKGNVHYLPEGSRLQGIEVARIIAKELGVKPLACPSVDEVANEMKAYQIKSGYKQKAVMH